MSARLVCDVVILLVGESCVVAPTHFFTTDFILLAVCAFTGVQWYAHQVVTEAHSGISVAPSVGMCVCVCFGRNVVYVCVCFMRSSCSIRLLYVEKCVRLRVLTPA